MGIRLYSSLDIVKCVETIENNGIIFKSGSWYETSHRSWAMADGVYLQCVGTFYDRCFSYDDFSRCFRTKLDLRDEKLNEILSE